MPRSFHPGGAGHPEQEVQSSPEQEGTHPLKEQENAGLSVFLYWKLMGCRMCHWPHEAGYRFDNRQIIESSLDSSLRTRPGLEGRRRASTGSVCGSILTSSSLAAASLSGQTCKEGSS